jgi:hypothetical protein
MLHFDEAEGARDLLGRLAPHIALADNWSEDLDFWIGAALSFEGLKALGVPMPSSRRSPPSSRAWPHDASSFAISAQRARALGRGVQAGQLPSGADHLRRRRCSARQGDCSDASSSTGAPA